MKRESLSPEERAEYDELVVDAGYNDDGEPWPSHEIADRLVAMLTDADQAGRAWARYMLDDAAAAGCLARWKRWHKAQRQIRILRNGVIVQKAAVTSLRRKSPSDGATHYQLTLWEEMTTAELKEVASAALSRADSEAATVDTAKKLMQLLTATGTSTVREALGVKSVTLEQYLNSLDAA